MAWQTSNKYKEIIYSGDAKHKLKLLFNGVEYETASVQTESLKVISKIISNGETRFCLDNLVSKEIELIIHDIDLEDIVDPIQISIGTLVDEEYEYVPIGIFNLSENPTTDKGKTTIKARDNSIKFDIPYDASEIISQSETKDVEMITLLQDICEKCGVELETLEFPNMHTKIAVWDNTVNARQYVMYIAEKAGRIATINRLGKLEFIDLQKQEDVTVEDTNGEIEISNSLNRKIKNWELLGKQDIVSGLQTISINNTNYELNLGKNIFDKDNVNILNVYINQNGVISNNDTRSIYIECKPNTTYTMQKYGSARFRLGTTTEIPSAGVSVSNLQQIDRDGSITITTGSNSKYLVAYIYATFDTNEKTLEEVLDTIQIEVGNEATEYTNYVPIIELDENESIKETENGWNLIKESETIAISEENYPTLYTQLSNLSESHTQKGENSINVSGTPKLGLKLTYALAKGTYELDPLLFEKYTAGDEIEISRVVYEDAIRKFEYGNENKQTLYINSANPYIVNASEVENVYEEMNGFNISSMNISKMIGNPALDPYDIIEFTYNDITYKTFAQNTLTYNGVILQSFNTQLGSKEKAQENVTIVSGETKFKRVFTKIDQVEGNVELNTSQIVEVQADLKDNYYTKEQSNILIQNAETGVTNTFSEAGGNNIFRNTGLWFADDKVTEYIYPSAATYPSITLYPLAAQHYEYWNGYVEKKKNENSSSMSSMLLKAGYLEQKQTVPNGNYTVSFKYKKLIELAVAKIFINDKEYELTSLEDTEFVTGTKDSEGNYIIDPIEVSNREIAVKFYSDIDNSCEIYDLMVNAGTVKLAYSQNQNETKTDTVNISRGITITSSDTDTIFKANADGIRTLNSNNKVLTEFTDTGMTTKKMKVTEESQICGTLIKEVGDQTWFTKL